MNKNLKIIKKVCFIHTPLMLLIFKYLNTIISKSNLVPAFRPSRGTWLLLIATLSETKRIPNVIDMKFIFEFGWHPFKHIKKKKLNSSLV